NSTCNPKNNSTVTGCSDTTNVISCTGSSTPGAFSLSNPTQYTVAEVGNTLNISWSYTAQTNVNRFPNKSIDIYFQSTVSYSSTKWEKNVTLGLSPKAMFYLWKIPQVQNGDFVIRLVADGIDPITSSTTCVPEGAPIPYISSQFLVVNPVQLATYPDPFPPSSSALKLCWNAALALLITSFMFVGLL
ncbi:hypothetical protein HK096_006812, partial [Nowakowskiella sp. JEL0078]